MKNINHDGNEIGLFNAGALDSIVNQALAMRDMYNSMVEVKEDVKSLKDEMVVLHKEVIDNVYLSSAQFSELKEIIHQKTKLAVVAIYGELSYSDFNKAFRRIVRRFWAIIKKEFEYPSKATEIKRMYYSEAIAFANSLTPSTYIQSCGKRGVPSL